jgi:hypothetical protein
LGSVQGCVSLRSELTAGAYASSIASLSVSLGSAIIYLVNPFPGDPEAGFVNNLIARLDLSQNAAVLAGVAASLAIGISLIPFSVLTSRAVVTPLRLPFSSAALRGLTSARERAEPWRLWTIPGLIANYAIQTISPIAVTTVTLPMLYGVAAASSPQMYGQGGASPEYFGLAYVLSTTAASLWMVPLAVLAEKMAVASDADEAETKALEAEFGRVAAEDVVQARPGPRYTGLIDAWTKVKSEEGIGALYRGWMWSAIALAAPAVTQVLAAAQAGRQAQM